MGGGGTLRRHNLVRGGGVVFIRNYGGIPPGEGGKPLTRGCPHNGVSLDCLYYHRLESIRLSDLTEDSSLPEASLFKTVVQSCCDTG